MECVSMVGQVQGDEGHDRDGKDQQQIHQGDGDGGGGENTLLALQETPEDPAIVDGDDVVCDEVVERVKEKPRLTLTTDMKPRLRWTRELHSLFVDVCNQLGGPKKATPKTVLELMDIDGLSLYHVKSHLQKYRMGRCTDNQYWTEAEIAETTVTPVSGSSSSGSPSNPITPRTNQNNRSRRGKRNPKNSTHGELYLKLEAEKCVQRCLEAQRMYLQTAVQRAYQTFTNQYPGDGAMGNSIMYGQASAGLGNFATMPAAGLSGYGTSSTTMPPFYFNQQNAYPPEYNTLTTPTNLNFQQQPLGYQPQASSFHLAPQGDVSTSYGYPGTGTTTYQEPSPVLADNEVLPADEDSVQVFLNWDDSEPQNLDNVLNL